MTTFVRSAIAAALLALLLTGCDRFVSTEPPPTYNSPTLETARAISGSASSEPAAPAASAASGTTK